MYKKIRSKIWFFLKKKYTSNVLFILYLRMGVNHTPNNDELYEEDFLSDLLIKAGFIPKKDDFKQLIEDEYLANIELPE